jgi:hypothetical protein
MPIASRQLRSVPAVRRIGGFRFGNLLRSGVFGLLLLAGILRPMLILACEIHAAAFAHAGQPHQHDHAAGAHAGDTADEDGHGEHQSSPLGAGAGAADVAAPLVLAWGARDPAAMPRMRVVAFAPRAAGAPFRPPIG